MITLTPPGPALSRACLQTAGGFCWWYADVVDDRGNGVVVIAGFGLPFLPGLAGAARDGEPVPPASRPSVNLAVYEAGRCTWYGLVEVASSSSSWTDGGGDDGRVEEQRFGACRFVRRVHDGTATFTAELDVALPCGRARGTIEVAGRARGPDEHGVLAVVDDNAAVADPSGPPRHDWSPQILHARGRVDLLLGDAATSSAERRVVVSGSGYHDRNGALAPLHALGIDHWCWARASFPDEDRVLYALWPDDGAPPRAFGVVVTDGGSRIVPSLRVQVRAATKNWLGLRRIDDVVAFDGDAPFLQVRAVHVVDDGPFYARALCAASSTDAPPDGVVCGVVETVAPHRVDVPWQRPFVQMRVTPTTPSSTSTWHPLFAGDARGRVGRLVRSLLSRSP
jgi:hypothetical protein